MLPSSESWNLHLEMLWNTTPSSSSTSSCPHHKLGYLPELCWIALLLVEIQPIRIKGKSLANKMIAPYNTGNQHLKSLWWKKWPVMLHKIHIHCENACSFLACDVSCNSQSSYSIRINNIIYWVLLPACFMVMKVNCRQCPWAPLVLGHPVPCSTYTTYLLFSCFLIKIIFTLITNSNFILFHLNM